MYEGADCLWEEGVSTITLPNWFLWLGLLLLGLDIGLRIVIIIHRDRDFSDADVRKILDLSEKP
jgi:hypothetical protein